MAEFVERNMKIAIGLFKKKLTLLKVINKSF